MFKIHASALSLCAAVAISSFAARADAQNAQTTQGTATTNRDAQFIATNQQGDFVTLDDSAGFGQKRQWVFSTEAGLSISRTTVSDADGAVTNIILQPAADYFVIKNLSVGGAVGLNYTKVGEQNSTRFLIGPRVGYNFEVSRMLSVWPKLGFSYMHTNQDSAFADNDNANAFALNLFAPVMLHPAPHFFAGFGPFLDTDLSGDTRATTWGFKLTLGGWLQPKG